MIKIPGGIYRIGTDQKEGFDADFETPSIEVNIESFYMDETSVTNKEFQVFVDATNYITEAEKFGWSYVFHLFVSDHLRSRNIVKETPWWIAVPGASWKEPEGPGSSISDRMDHPVVHITRNDAVAYCRWSGKRLPTEAEWEVAAKGGTEFEKFYWGEELVLSDGVHRCNTWQGIFPTKNTKEDGYLATAPVKTYPANPLGLYEMIGNVWEWCVNPGKLDLSTFQIVSGQDFWREYQVIDDALYAIKGGSFLCHSVYCNRYRMNARNSSTAMSSSQNMGFRCVRDIIKV
ncbi:hypothetical protein SUT007_02240 [Streptococcus parasuis]|nr:hypothetical protein SUT007_02240 [Streptococcus parasuis]